MAKAMFLLLAVAVGGGVYFYLNYDFEVQKSDRGLEAIRIVPRTGSRAPATERLAHQPSDESSRPTIRIATFSADRLDERKLANRHVGDVLAHLMPHFDVVAVQDIRAANHGVLLRLVDQVNAAGHQFDFVTAETVARGRLETFSAFLFDRAAVEVDRRKVDEVEDPAGRFRHAPIAAQFRVRGPDPVEAFTFQLVNVHLDADQLPTERDLLDDVYRAVRDRYPDEDDVILLGNFAAEDPRPSPLAGMLDVTAAVSDVPTTLGGIRYPVDNIWYNRRATTEFAGRAEVFDVMRAFDLTRREVEEVSDHLPVWAEFSSYEGGSLP